MPVSLRTLLIDVLDAASGAARVPRLFERIEGPCVTHDPDATLVDGEEFRADECYFGLRLAGMHLHDSRRFATHVLPLCVCLAEFRRAGKPHSVPFSLGPDTIRQRLQSARGSVPTTAGKPLPAGWVEMRDIAIVRPTPAPSGDLELFVGLYSVPGDDVVRSLLNVMGSISRAFGGAVTPALDVASTLYGGFATLLGLDGVTSEAEGYEGRTLRKSGYLLVSNAAANSPFKGKLFVSGGRLRHGNSPDSPLVTEFDYCLLAVERYETVLTGPGLAPDLFDQAWQKVVDGAHSSPGAADAAFRDLARIIYGSPDLIVKDRDLALASYRLDYEKALKAFGPAETRSEDLRGGDSKRVASVLTRFPDIYPLFREGAAPDLSPEEEARLNSGVPDPDQIAKLREALAKTPPGAVADAIMRAS